MVLLHGSDVTASGTHWHMLQKVCSSQAKRIIDNIALPLTEGRLAFEARARAQEMLNKWWILSAWHKKLATSSGGMRQRTGSAHSAYNSHIMLLDEPFSAQDALTRREMLRGLCLPEGVGLSALVITHDVDEAVAMASRIYVMAAVPRCVATKIVGVVEPQGCAGNGGRSLLATDLASFDLSTEF